MKGEIFDKGAANSAKEDLAFSAYLVNHVNKPIYGFRKEITDINQIFGVLGISGAQQLIYSYMLSLLSPKKWIFFKLNLNSFYNLQADLGVAWHKILKHLNIRG